MRILPLPLVSLALFLLPSCTILHVDSATGPPRVQVGGLIDGHLALGIRDEPHLLHASLFDGSSPGSIAEIVIWKLFRLEIGVAGVAVGVGPIDAGLGVLFYDPCLPRFLHGDRDHDEEKYEEVIVREREDVDEPHRH